MTTTYNKRQQADNHQKGRLNMQERVRAGLRIPYDLNTWLILEAEKQGLSKNALILKILWNHKEQKEEFNKPLQQ